MPERVYNNILETIGNTPLVRLNRVVADLPCKVYAKVETFNPGNSIKDRMALKMLEVAEKEGKIKLLPFFRPTVYVVLRCGNK